MGKANPVITMNFAIGAFSNGKMIIATVSILLSVVIIVLILNDYCNIMAMTGRFISNSFKSSFNPSGSNCFWIVS